MSDELSKVIIKVFPVLHGDCIAINYLGNDLKKHNIIIDGGFQSTYERTLKRELKRIERDDENIDLLIVTHTDQDHIGGILKLFKNQKYTGLVNKVWYNSSNVDPEVNTSNMISVKEGIQLRKLLNKNDLLVDENITTRYPQQEFFGAKIKVISPQPDHLDHVIELFEEFESKKLKISQKFNDYDKSIEELNSNNFIEDKQPYNASSISILLELWGKKVLFLADSIPSVISKWLKNNCYATSERLKLDFIKVSHHGSISNTSSEMLSMVNCENYIISANGKNRYNFPHKETLARIVNRSGKERNTTFYFNYDNELLRSIFTKEELEYYNITCHYGSHLKDGLIIKY
jgi:beta-lactamase superfamily II metal-dependent hydrolase